MNKQKYIEVLGRKQKKVEVSGRNFEFLGRKSSTK